MRLLRYRIRFIALFCLIGTFASPLLAEDLIAIFRGSFGSADAIGTTDVSNEQYVCSMRYSSDTPDAISGAGRGWFFGDEAKIYSTVTGVISIINDGDPPNHNGDTHLDVIDNKSPGLFWFGLDFPDSPTGVAGLYNAPVYGNPDNPGVFGPLTPVQQVYQFNSIPTSIGIFSSNNDGTVESASLSRVGDANGDGELNLLDVAPFVDAIMKSEFDFIVDINSDGGVNLLDVAPFVDLLSGG